jgi:hypothetical protein
MFCRVRVLAVAWLTLVCFGSHLALFRQANALWAAIARTGDASRLPALHSLYMQAYETSPNRSFFEGFWESLRVATVGCLHRALPPREVIHETLERELAAGGGGETRVSHMVALMHLDPPHLASVARAWARAFEPPPPLQQPSPAAPPRRRPWDASRRLAVGVLSANLGDHPVGHHITPLLRHLDRARFDLACFALPPCAATGSAGLRSDASLEANGLACGGLTALPSAPGEQAAALAHLDIIVYLDGYEGKGHGMAALALLAQRPGVTPTVVSFFGFLATLGADYVHALVGDATATPPSSLGPHFRERLLLHSGTFFVQNYRERHPELFAAAAGSGGSGGAGPPDPAAPFAFCSFSRLWKVSPATWESWLTILLRTGNATELLLPNEPPISIAGLLQHPLLTSSPSLRSRIHFLAPLPLSEHLLVKGQRCGLGLDTEHHNGHVSSADLLAAGVPMLTVEGGGFGGRVTASLNKAAGAPALFTVLSHSAYVETAVAVYEAYAQRAVVRGLAEAGFGALGEEEEEEEGEGGAGGLLWRPTLGSLLFDTARWVAGFEEVLQSAATW